MSLADWLGLIGAVVAVFVAIGGLMRWLLAGVTKRIDRVEERQDEGEKEHERYSQDIARVNEKLDTHDKELIRIGETLTRELGGANRRIEDLAKDFHRMELKQGQIATDVAVVKTILEERKKANG